MWAIILQAPQTATRAGPRRAAVGRPKAVMAVAVAAPMAMSPSPSLIEASNGNHHVLPLGDQAVPLGLCGLCS